MSDQTLRFAANYVIKNRKPLTGKNRKLWPRLTDQNITLLEKTAEAYGLSVSDLAQEVAEIDRELTERSEAR
jgi:hypothetical protein